MMDNSLIIVKENIKNVITRTKNLLNYFCWQNEFPKAINVMDPF